LQDVFSFISNSRLLSQILTFILTAAIAGLLAFVFLRLSRKLFRGLRAKKPNVSFRFGEKIVRFVVVFLLVMWIVMSNDLTRSFGQSLFQSTAVIAAVAGFAAQSVLSDLICGMIISSTKPFAVGDRIELENGVAGIVTDMTLRHVVLRGIDTQYYIIPNSKVNAQYVRNMSYQRDGIRSVDFHFSVSYDTDPEEACRVIRRAVMDSPYSVPGLPRKGKKDPDYADVYFLAFKDSGLDLATTGYYTPDTPTEAFKTDVNTRVRKALADSGIEIPYNYMNLILAQREAKQERN
jgi:small-conductance mechanosensitive channel